MRPNDGAFLMLSPLLINPCRRRTLVRVVCLGRGGAPQWQIVYKELDHSNQRDCKSLNSVSRRSFRCGPNSLKVQARGAVWLRQSKVVLCQ